MGGKTEGNGLTELRGQVCWDTWIKDLLSITMPTYVQSLKQEMQVTSFSEFN